MRVRRLSVRFRLVTRATPPVLPIWRAKRARANRCAITQQRPPPCALGRAYEEWGHVKQVHLDDEAEPTWHIGQGELQTGDVIGRGERAGEREYDGAEHDISRLAHDGGKHWGDPPAEVGDT